MSLASIRVNTQGQTNCPRITDLMNPTGDPEKDKRREQL